MIEQIRTPEFGNRVHIHIVKKYEAIMSGKYPIHEIDWGWANYIKGGGNSKPVFKYVDDAEHADCVVDYVPCPNCHKHHILLQSFNPHQVHYDKLMEIDVALEDGFNCYNCGLEFSIDFETNNVYVNPYHDTH